MKQPSYQLLLFYQLIINLHGNRCFFNEYTDILVLQHPQGLRSGLENQLHTTGQDHYLASSFK